MGVGASLAAASLPAKKNADRSFRHSTFHQKFRPGVGAGHAFVA